MLASIHGISRNAFEHAARFIPYADKFKVAIVAPCYSTYDFNDYQRLGRKSRGARADLALYSLTQELREALPFLNGELYLFGYSGGGQFVHRYVMAHPEGVTAYAVGAAGWYTFPDSSLEYPQGILKPNELDGVIFSPERFLKIPALILVGERDVHPGTALNKCPEIVQQQGSTRMERGLRWTQAMNKAAREHGLETEFRFEILSRSNHCFEKSMRRGQMGDLIFDYFF